MNNLIEPLVAVSNTYNAAVENPLGGALLGSYYVGKGLYNLGSKAVNAVSYMSGSEARKEAMVKDVVKRLRRGGVSTVAPVTYTNWRDKETRTYRPVVPRNRMILQKPNPSELKSVDLASTAYACSTTGSVTCINLIRTGSTFTNRIGRRIQLMSLYLNGYMAPEAGGSLTTYCRILIVYDRQSNGNTPVWADVVSAYDQATTQSGTVMDNMNLNNRDRFKIILDKRIVCPNFVAGVNQGVYDNSASEMQIQEHRRLGGLETQYKADSSPAVIGDIATGSLVMLTFGNSAAGSGHAFIGTVRLRFTDL